MTISELQAELAQQAELLGPEAEVVILTPDGDYVNIRNSYQQEFREANHDGSSYYTSFALEAGDDIYRVAF